MFKTQGLLNINHIIVYFFNNTNNNTNTIFDYAYGKKERMEKFNIIINSLCLFI